MSILNARNIVLSLALPTLAASCSKTAEGLEGRKLSEVQMFDGQGMDVLMLCHATGQKIIFASSVDNMDLKGEALKEYFLKFDLLALLFEKAAGLRWEQQRELSEEEFVDVRDLRIEIGKAYGEVKIAFCAALPLVSGSNLESLKGDFQVARNAYENYDIATRALFSRSE